MADPYIDPLWFVISFGLTNEHAFWTDDNCWPFCSTRVGAFKASDFSRTRLPHGCFWDATSDCLRVWGVSGLSGSLLLGACCEDESGAIEIGREELWWSQSKGQMVPLTWLWKRVHKFYRPVFSLETNLPTLETDTLWCVQALPEAFGSAIQGRRLRLYKMGSKKAFELAKSALEIFAKRPQKKTQNVQLLFLFFLLVFNVFFKAKIRYTPLPFYTEGWLCIAIL